MQDPVLSTGSGVLKKSVSGFVLAFEMSLKYLKVKNAPAYFSPAAKCFKASTQEANVIKGFVIR